MQRAYEALGLPYSSQAAGQARGAAGGPTTGAQNAPAQQQQLPQMRSLNALGTDKRPHFHPCDFYQTLNIFPSFVKVYILIDRAAAIN